MRKILQKKERKKWKINKRNEEQIQFTKELIQYFASMKISRIKIETESPCMEKPFKDPLGTYNKFY